jgi:hypothetical protein
VGNYKHVQCNYYNYYCALNTADRKKNPKTQCERDALTALLRPSAHTYFTLKHFGNAMHHIIDRKKNPKTQRERDALTALVGNVRTASGGSVSANRFMRELLAAAKPPVPSTQLLDMVCERTRQEVAVWTLFSDPRLFGR